ncbi:MAG: response regulator [Rivularia sp. T60_A2020_040]|nr:response regulator [Rivularia sp. T60_A2020_040]
MLPEQQQRILGYFIEEATDHLNTIEQGLLNLQSTLNDPDLINEVFRAAHSIKGGAAMLGLNSIQRTSHRLEDCFKVLKDSPVKIDQKLESLFLGVSDTLKVLLEHLSGPFGLTEETANTLMAEAEPVFTWLHEHLEKLVQQSTGGNGVVADTENRKIQQNLENTAVSTGNNYRQLQAEVLSKLRQMLQLFKQPATAENRQKLCECTDYLAGLGYKFNLSAWSHLCRSVTKAIATEENTYLTLAKIAITEIKQALELVLANRENQIVISEQLEALIPAAEVEFLDISNLEFDQPDTELLVNPQPDNYSEVAAVEALYLTDQNNQADSVEAEDNINSLFELSDQLDDNVDDSVDRDAPTVIHELNIHGPEVGVSELNTLADLFAGESSELDENWQQEKIIDQKIEKSQKRDGDVEANIDQAKDTDSEFADFLSFEQESSQDNPTTAKEEMTIVQLFGEDFSELDLEDFKNTGSKEFAGDDLFANDGEQEINDLLELSFDDNNDYNTGEDELDSLFDQPVSHSQQSTEKTLDFDDLFTEAAVDEVPDITAQEEIFDLPNFEEVGLNTLFGEFETPKEEEDYSDLFDDSSTEVIANLGNIWEKTEIIPHEDVAKILEDNLLEVSNSQVSEAISPDLELEDLEDNSNDSTFSSDTLDDLLELTLSAENADDRDLLVTAEEDNLSLIEVDNQDVQKSSAVEDYFLATFSEQDNLNLLEVDDNDVEQLAVEDLIEEDLFTTFSEQDNLNLLEVDDNDVEQLAVEDLIEEDLIEEDLFTSFSEQDNLNLLEVDNDIDNPFAQPSPEIDYTESSFDLEIAAEVISHKDSSQELEKITTNSEAQLIDDLFSQDIAFDDEISLQATSKEEKITFLPFNSESNQEEELKFDDFSDLESLLEQQEFPDAEFAALEDLLVFNNDQENDTPVAVNTEDTSTINDEFSDLENLLKQANTSIPRTSQSNSTSPKNTRSSKGEQLMRVPVKHLDNLSNLVGELVVNRNTLEQDQERMRQSLDNLLHQVQNLSDVGARMQELYERSLLEASLLASRKDNSGGGNYNFNTDRGFSELEMDRFTPFHTLSQEMIELIVRVRESASDIDFVVEDNERVARQFRQVTSQLQEGITRSRMEAFSQVTTRLERGVRDNSIKCGKQVNLIIEGQDTLVDKMILQYLTDPLTHLLNNAIVHGIETPEERESRGKPAQGTIKIRAFHQGNQTVISVSDDGAGIDAEKVKKKAVKVGLITAEQAKTISRMEVYELLFHSGFSTKDEADQLAGRGVGMDVVRTSISEIRGAITTDSSLGKGTKFTIRLPLTLSICKALCCVSDKARIAFPMDGVEDTMDMPVKSIREDADGKKYILWRERKLPFRPLKELLTFNRLLSRGIVYGGNRDDDMISVIAVRSGNTMIALQIDQVLSEQEIVIKQFEGPAPKPVGVAGATILGDGRIMPIVDVLELIDIFEGRTSKQSTVSLWEQKDTFIPVEPADAKIDPTVLIVDDSITVRELLSLTFTKAGYRVEQARDGQEAWDKLRSGLPCDIVFCDIEMPRCDGLELLSRIQKNPDLNNLPIAMLTSRGADKHRQMAIQLGASGYFTKPYLEEALLEAAVRMLKGEKLVVTS